MDGVRQQRQLDTKVGGEEGGRRIKPVTEISVDLDFFLIDVIPKEVISSNPSLLHFYFHKCVVGCGLGRAL